MQGIRESAGWGPASWWPRSNFVEFKDTNRSPSFSGNWRRCFPLGRRLSNGERHRRVGFARAATFHGVSGDSEKAPDATLIVMSDHGFSTFDRAVHLNTWLMKEGFLTLDDPKNVGDEELFPHVDWSRTQAYSMGLNGVYLNLQGREPQGTVAPGVEADAVLQKLAAKMQDARDPDTGKPMIGGVTLSHRDFHGGMLDAAPDIIVGYMPGYRSP